MLRLCKPRVLTDVFQGQSPVHFSVPASQINISLPLSSERHLPESTPASHDTAAISTGSPVLAEAGERLNSFELHLQRNPDLRFPLLLKGRYDSLFIGSCSQSFKSRRGAKVILTAVVTTH